MSRTKFCILKSYDFWVLPPPHSWWACRRWPKPILGSLRRAIGPTRPTGAARATRHFRPADRYDGGARSTTAEPRPLAPHRRQPRCQCPHGRRQRGSGGRGNRRRNSHGDRRDTERGHHPLPATFNSGTGNFIQSGGVVALSKHGQFVWRPLRSLYREWREAAREPTSCRAACWI